MTAEHPTETSDLLDRLRRATIGRYDIYAELGSGGMASVFLALDLALDRKVAIKVLAPELARKADNVARFRREAKVAAALDHPNIIGILAVGDDPQLAYFVMKYVEGSTLDAVIAQEGAQSVAFARSVLATAGRALQFAHARGVVHRDVKPANLMLDLEGRLIVTDFGIAKQEDAQGLTVTGSVVGTPYYMSPEQFNGLPVSGATDQYALGVVAYELLTGVQPYRGATVGEVMRGHLFDPIPSVRETRADVPAALDAAITRMLAKQASDRFATMDEAVRALEGESVRDESAVRTQIIALARSGAQRRPEIHVPLSPSPAVRTVVAARASTRRLVALGAVTLVLGAGGATVALRPDLLGLGSAPPAPDTTTVAAPTQAVLTPPSLDTATRGTATRDTATRDTVPAATPQSSAPRPRRALGGRERAAPSDPDATPGPASNQTATPAATTPATAPATPPEPPPAPTTGTVVLGSRIALSALYVNDDAPVPARGLKRIAVPAGTVRLSIRSTRCPRWDSTFTVVAGTVHTIGYRPGSC